MEELRMDVDDKLQLIDELKGFSETNSIPEGTEKRQQTNRIWLIIFGIAFSVVIAFIIYASQKADIDRAIHGFDYCGNVCGKKNSPVEGVPCSGKDMEDKPYLLLVEADDYPKIESLKCVDACPPHHFFMMNTCINNMKYKYTNLMTSIQAVLNGLYMASDRICYMFLVALGMTTVFILLLRYATKVVIWAGAVGFMFVFLAFGMVLWLAAVKINKTGDYDMVANYNLMPMVIVCTVIPILAIIMAFFMVKRIKLVIMIVEEVMKAIFDTPMVLLQPVLTFVVIVIGAALYLYVNILLLTSGKLYAIFYAFNEGTGYTYKIQAIGIFTMILNTCFTAWVIEFIFGCQHMIVSGTISAWYFCRDKASLASPVYNSWYNLVRYHLGTVAVGSLIITIITILRAMLRGMARRYRCLVQCICGPIESILRYLTKNALIQTAMHGTPFWPSGKKAVRIFLANIVDVSALNFVTYFVLFTLWGLIVMSSIITGILLYDNDNEFFPWAIYAAAIMSGVLARSVLATVEVAIDTLFMCYCEDSLINDGVVTPYFMSTNLKLFVEQSKTVIPHKKEDILCEM